MFSRLGILCILSLLVVGSTIAYFTSETFSLKQRRDAARAAQLEAARQFHDIIKAGAAGERDKFEAAFYGSFQVGLLASDVQYLLDTGHKDDKGDEITYEWYNDHFDHGCIYHVVVARPSPSAADHYEIHPMVIKTRYAITLPST